MGGKILFVGAVIMAVLLSYFFITVIWSSVMTPAISTAANATSSVTYPFSHWGIKTMPLWLYVTPAACGIIAIVWKLRQPDG